MDRIDSLQAILNDLARALDADELDPDPSRAEWGSVRHDIAAMRAWVKVDAFREYAERLAASPPEDTQTPRTRTEYAVVLGELAVLLRVSGDAEGAQVMFDLALAFALPTTPEHDELTAAKTEREGYGALVRARWLHRHKRWKEGDAVVSRAIGKVKDAKLKARLDLTLEGPRPMEGGAPGLFTLNGFGVMLYGNRDRWSDGSYVATTWLTAVFVPVFPLRSYRVRDNQGGGWMFFARERLSRFARFYRALVIAAAMAVGASHAYTTWHDGSDRLGAIAVDAAGREEAAHHDEAALAGYDRALRTYGAAMGTAQMERAANGVLRLAMRAQRGPATAADVERLMRVVRRYENLPPEARTETVAQPFVAKVLQWADEIGTATPEAFEASLQLLSHVAPLSTGAQRTTLDRRVAAMHLQVGERLASAWPMEALSHFVASGAAGIEGARPVVEAILRSPALTHAAHDDLVVWCSAVDRFRLEGLRDLRRLTATRLTEAAALRDNAERRQVLEEGDAVAMEAYLSLHPTDQEAVAAWATRFRGDGPVDTLLARFEALGGAGFLAPDVRRTYAQLLVEKGRLAEADTLLDRTLDLRIPRYQAALRRWTDAIESLESAEVDHAHRDTLPPDLNQRLQGLNQTEQQRVFNEYITDLVRQSPTIQGLRAAVEVYGDVVPMALSSATLKLRRANALAGDARTAMLAKAEGRFLVIRQQAEGTPAFRIGYGQVLYRMGRAEEGDRLLQQVVAGEDDNLKLNVASVYRELGVNARARAITETVFSSATGPLRSEAAMMRSILADDREEEANWLRRVADDNPVARTRLRSIEAQNALEAGRFEEADRAFAEEVSFYAHQPQSGAAANNGSIALHFRFEATGNVAHIDASVRLMEAALQRDPGNAVATSNAAMTYLQQGCLRVLGRRVRLSALRPKGAELYLYLAYLERGPDGDAVRDELRREPSIVRGLDLLRQTQALSPGLTIGYSGERGTLEMLQDARGLEGLLQRIARAESLNVADSLDEEARRRRGDLRNEDLRDARATVTRSGLIVPLAEATHHDLTIRFARLAHADARRALALVTFDAAMAREAATEAAAAADGATGFSSVDAAWDTITAATLEVAATQPSLRTTLEAENEFVTVIVQTAAQPEGAAIVRAIAARPGVTEALATIREAQRSDPSLGALELGRAFGDAALTTAAEPALTRDWLRLGVEVRARLAPTAYNQRRAALFSRR